MSDKVEVKIVGDDSGAKAAMRGAAQAVADATQTMRTKMGEIQASSRSAFGGMGREAKEGSSEVQQSLNGLRSTMDSVKSHFTSFIGGFKEGWREADTEIKRAAASAAKARDEMGKSSQGGGGGGMLSGAMAVFKGGLMLEAVSKLKELGTATVATSAEFERLRSVLLTLEGTQAAANARFGDLKKFATETPYELTEVVGAFGKLKAQGLDPSRAALTAYGNTAAGMGKSLDQMVEAVADASMGEFERLKEFGIKAVDAGDHVVMNFKGQATNVKKNSADIQAYLQKIGNTDFAGAMARQMDTLGGKFSNLSDAAASFADEIGQGGLSQAIKDAADSMTGAAGTSGELGRQIGQVLGVVVKSVMGIIRTFGDIVSDTFSFVKQIVTDTMGKSAGASITWGNALQGLGAVLAGFAGVVRAVYTIIGAAVRIGIDAFMTFTQVVNSALSLDFSGMVTAVQNSVNRQVDIVKTGYGRIKEIVNETKASMTDAMKDVKPPAATNTPLNNTTTGGTNFGANRGGGAKKAKGAGAGGGAPSEMDQWRTGLQDALLGEEQAGRDTIAYTAQFWQKKLALTKTGTKQELEVKRELGRALIAQNRAQDQETKSQIRDTLQMKMDAANADIELSRIVLDEKMQTIDAERQAGIISETEAIRRKAQANQQKLDLDAELEQRQYDIKHAALADETKLYAIGTREYANHLRQIEILERQHTQRMLIINRTADAQEKKDDQALSAAKRQGLNAWSQQWGQQIAKLVTLQQGFSATVKGIWNDMVGNFAAAIARMVQQWIIGLITKEAASTASQRKEVLKTAKEAAAGAYSAVVKIPIVGPILAPIAAATAFAATAAFSAKDGYDVPALAGAGVDGKGGQLGVVHPREMVLPEHLADVVRNGGGGGLTVQISAMDGQSVKRLFMDNRGAVAEAIRKYTRDGGR